MNWTLHSNAKLNLFLHLIGRNEKNYHLIQSAMHFLDLSDAIHIKKSDELSVQFKLNENIVFPELDEKNNSIIKIISEFCDIYNLDRKFSILVEKNIPSGAGLGGGSANAATILNFLIDYYNVKITEDEKKKIALKVGCDTVPCMYGKQIFVEGVGEVISDLDLDDEILNSAVLIVYPQIFSSSIDAYKLFRKNEYQFSDEIYINQKVDYNFLRKCTNDLTKPVIELFPEIGVLLAFLSQYENDDTIIRMSGSGSVCFVLSKNQDLLMNIKEQLSVVYPNYFVSLNRFLIDF